MITTLKVILIFGLGFIVGFFVSIKYFTYLLKKTMDEEFKNWKKNRHNVTYNDLTRYNKRKEPVTTDTIFLTRGEAEDVLDNMPELMKLYGMVNVADFIDITGGQSTFKDHKFGWTDLNHASIMRVRGGYKINLPITILLEDSEGRQNNEQR